MKELLTQTTVGQSRGSESSGEQARATKTVVEDAVVVGVVGVGGGADRGGEQSANQLQVKPLVKKGVCD